MVKPKPEKDKSLESWIWDAACSIRGAKDAPKYKDYILPLIFTKRLCDVFDDELNRIAAEVGSRNAGTSKEKTVRQWFVDHDLIESVLYLPEPSGARQTARQDSPKGERGGANQNLFYNSTAPGIVLFLNRSKPKKRKGKIFLVNASQVFEKGDPKNFIPDEGIQRIADTLIGWKEEEKLSRIVDHAELKKNDYNISPSRYIHTSDAETYRPIAEIVEELKVIELEAKETDKALGKILKQLGI
jgi:type I restriction enzyme M protein